MNNHLEVPIHVAIISQHAPAISQQLQSINKLIKVVVYPLDRSAEINPTTTDLLLADLTLPPEFIKQFYHYFAIVDADTEQNLIHAVRQGVNRVLTYPFDLPNLRSIFQHLADHKRQESEAKFQKLFFSHSAPMLLLDPDSGQILEANNAAINFYGYSPETIRQKNIADINTANLNKQSKLRQQVITGECHRFSFIHRLANDEQRFVEVYSSPIQYLGKLCLFSIIHDVTDRELFHQGLLAEERRFRELADALPEIIFELTADNKLSFVNNFAIHRLRLEPDKVGENFDIFAYFDPSEHYRLRKYIARVLARKIHTLEEFTLVTNQNERLPVELSFSPIIDQEQIIGFRGVLRDISERKKHELILKESEAKYRTLFEDSLLAMSLTLHGRIVDVNRAWLMLHGYTYKEEVINRDVADIVCVEDQDVLAQRRRTGVTEADRLKHYRDLRADGSVVDVESFCSPLTVGGETAILTYVRDATISLALEEEKDKTQRLSSLGILAGGIAHDFNNLLAAIIGNIELSKLDPNLEQETLTYLQQADEATTRAQKLTRQLLTFARGGECKIETINGQKLNYLIRSSANLALSGRNITPKFELGEVGQVAVDSGQIGQVIQNLVINAYQAMPQGGNITVRTTAYHDSSDWILMEVVDTGTGISKENLAKIFDPYFTTKRNQKMSPTDEKNSGLGLTISYSIINKHGGKILVKSKLGKGTTFQVYLPERHDQVTPADKIRAREEINLKDRKILVMDDQEEVAKPLCIYLKKQGAKVTMCQTGQIAVCKYEETFTQKKPYDIVILDMTIRGGWGGEKTLQEIRKINPQAIVMVSSGYAETHTGNYRELGFNDSVSKPYTFDQIGLAIQRLLTTP